MVSQELPIPNAPGEVTPGWLTAVLREAGAQRHVVVRTVNWEIIGEDRGFTGVVARLCPQYAGGDLGWNLPVSVIAKFPTAPREVASTYTAAQERDNPTAQRHYERSAREVQFYTEIAPHSPIPTPRLYYSAVDDAIGQVVLLLEDLGTAWAGDQLAGCSPAEATLVLDAIAPFHARWWGRLGSETFPWLQPWSSDHRARQERYNQRVEPFLARFGDALPDAVHDLLDRLRTGYAAVLERLAQAPATIIHADLHLDNVLFNPSGSHPPVVVLDWQGVCLGAAAVDVALLLFGSLDVEVRRVSEDQILQRYHRLLTEHGVTGYSLDQLRDDCRLALLWLLAGTVGWLSAGGEHISGRERALMQAALGNGRLMATLRDHDVATLLNE